VVLNLGSRDPLRVPNANLGGPKRKSGISTNFPQYFCLALITSWFVYTLRTQSYLASHSSSVFSSFLFSLVYSSGGQQLKLKLPYTFQENVSYLLYSGAHTFSIMTWGSQTTSVVFRGSQQWKRLRTTTLVLHTDIAIVLVGRYHLSKDWLHHRGSALNSIKWPTWTGLRRLRVAPSSNKLVQPWTRV